MCMDVIHNVSIMNNVCNVSLVLHMCNTQYVYTIHTIIHNNTQYTHINTHITQYTILHNINNNYNV